VALLIGAVEFGVSLHRLLDEPFRYGIKHDLALGDDGSRSLQEGLQQTVEADPDVAAMVLYASNFAHAGRVDVQLLGMDVIRGDAAPTVVRGRLPSASDEIALGRSTARDTGVGVGGSVELQGPAATRSFRVVGIAVIPGFGANEGVGSGGLVTMAGLQTLDPAAAPNVITVAFDRARPGGIERLAAQLGLQRQDPWRPAVIVNASRVSDVPFVLAGLVSALCLLTVVTAAIGSVRCRQREFAILRALGAGGRWVTMAIGWQATLLASVPAVAGAVIGAVLGQQVFARFADGIGAIDDAAMPLRVVLLVVLGLVVVANVAVLLPGRSLRRVAPAMRLQAE
jgi:putative ABC transport system permease protein